MIEQQGDWFIKYHTVVAAVENPKAVGWSWANDSAGYKGNVYDDTILIHVECNATYGKKKKRMLFILEYNIICEKKPRTATYHPTLGREI